MRLALLLFFSTLTAVGARADDRADCLGSRDNIPARIAACSRLIERQGTAADRTPLSTAYLNRGIAHSLSRANDAAIADFTRVLEIRKKHKQALNERGIAYANKGERALARTDFERAMAIDPAYVAPINNRARMLVVDGNYDQAIAEFDRVLALNPNYLLAYLNRGRAYARKGDRAHAIADLQAGLALTPATTSERASYIEALRDIRQLGAAPPARRIALVIGNGRYAHAPILANPGNDAQALAAKLTQLGFQQVIVHNDLDLKGLTDALQEFGDLAEDADWAVVFFAGHGIEMGGINYLIPTDARLQRDSHVKDEAMALDRVIEKVQGAKHMRLVFLDACRNNPFASRMVRSAGAMRSASGGLADINPGGGALVIYAAKHGSTAQDGAGANSPFTEAILEHIEEPGLDVVTMAGKVRQSVLKKTANGQEPWMYGAPSPERHFFRMR